VRSQSDIISRSGSNFASFVGSVPAIQTLMRRIRSRKTRDSTIIAIVIALCICFTIWYIIA